MAETLALIGSALGLSLSSGLSLYGAAFLVGLAIRLEWVHLAPSFQHLAVLADPLVLTVAGILFAIEFLADKIPWLDSAWDAVHTVIRPVGGALLAVRVFGELSPPVEVIALLLLGSVTLAAHGAKASLRLAVNTSPEPLSNILLSLSENALLAGGVWLALTHPFLTLAVSVGVLVLVAWAAAWLAGHALRGLRAFRARAAARFPSGRGSLG